MKMSDKTARSRGRAKRGTFEWSYKGVQRNARFFKPMPSKGLISSTNSTPSGCSILPSVNETMTAVHVLFNEGAGAAHG